ncbi:MAG: insulinase family protein [Bacteroidales bacterium]|jgi:predicted Zn-dependent peptidase|nr:insulinase family protein [Bacteroidales bacterium]
MKRIIIIGFIYSILVGSLLAQKQYKYESVPNDPIKLRIYTLDNGLKVYMSVNKEEPKIQIILATNAGSKLDPSETTGLAHYFEHLMFKGTTKFGTTNWEAEKPLLDQIEQLFEVYRKTTDEKERKRIYAQIDSISQIASTYAIPNEYQKLMAVLGSDGTNAYTSQDFTNYIENIPANQLENYLIIQTERFQNPVLRLFHTELETIYEEKNMSLTGDGSRKYTALMEGLFPKHPYGNQTTLGTQEHLRNPSITNIKKFFETYYVPNNMALIMAGDFDPDAAIVLIDQYLGVLKPSPIPEFKFEQEDPITTPVVKEVVGKEAESLFLGWRLGNPLSEEILVMTLAEMILTNGHAGLVDLNINQKQRLLNAGSMPMLYHDYSSVIMFASPKKGQTLEEARDILLEQIDSLQQGNFPDWLLQACINDLRLRDIQSYKSNRGRTSAMEEVFSLDIPWANEVNELDEMEKITKEQIMDFAKKYLRRDNYVVVYKRQGKPTDIEKVKKPKITPIKINRDDKSDFVKMIEDRKVPEIQPVFVDIQKELHSVKAQNDVTVYYSKNEDNEAFSLRYIIDMGVYQDRYFDIASDYITYLGTDKYTPEQIKQEFYKIGCSFSMYTSSRRSYINISGLTKSMEEGMKLLEHLLQNAKPNQEALNNLVNDILKYRENAKSNQMAIMSYLVQYGIYGLNSPTLYSQLSEKELKSLTPEMLINKLKEWMTYKQYAIYYGPETPDKVVAAINAIHNPKDLKDIPAPKTFTEEVPAQDHVYVVHYDAPQVMLYTFSFGNKFQKELTPYINLYNEYFGGGMNAIVFQEMREARSLAYGAGAYYSSPSTLEQLSYHLCYISCGTDKLKPAIEAFNELLLNMPENEASFTIAKDAVLTSIRTNRIAPEDLVWYYLFWKDLNLNEDPNKAVFEKIQTLNFADVKQFQQEYVSNKPRTFVVLGNTKEMDMKYLKKVGKVKTLKLKDIFSF